MKNHPGTTESVRFIHDHFFSNSLAISIILPIGLFISHDLILTGFIILPVQMLLKIPVNLVCRFHGFTLLLALERKVLDDYPDITRRQPLLTPTTRFVETVICIKIILSQGLIIENPLLSVNGESATKCFWTFLISTLLITVYYSLLMTFLASWIVLYIN